MSQSVLLHRWTRDDYERAVNAGRRVGRASGRRVDDAESGVEEYWVTNLIEVHFEIVVGRYQRIQRFERGDTITLQHFPDVTIAVSDVIG